MELETVMLSVIYLRQLPKDRYGYEIPHHKKESNWKILNYKSLALIDLGSQISYFWNE